MILEHTSKTAAKESSPVLLERKFVWHLSSNGVLLVLRRVDQSHTEKEDGQW